MLLEQTQFSIKHEFRFYTKRKFKKHRKNILIRICSIYKYEKL